MNKFKNLLILALSLGAAPYCVLAVDSDEEWNVEDASLFFEDQNHEGEQESYSDETLFETLALAIQGGENIDNLNRIPNAEERDAEGNNLLHIAMRSNNAQTRYNIQQLVHTHGYDINTQNNAGGTPLEVAIHHHNDLAVEVLVQRGANPLAIATNGQTMVDLAAEYNRNLAPQLRYTPTGLNIETLYNTLQQAPEVVQVQPAQQAVVEAQLVNVPVQAPRFGLNPRGIAATSTAVMLLAILWYVVGAPNGCI